MSEHRIYQTNAAHTTIANAQTSTSDHMAEVRRAMNAWNAMTGKQRAAALAAANTASPATAMRNLGFKIPVDPPTTTRRA